MMGANRREFLGRTGLARAAATIGLAWEATGQDRATDREDATPRGGARVDQTRLFGIIISQGNAVSTARSRYNPVMVWRPESPLGS